MLPSDPCQIVVDALVLALANARTLDAGRPALRAAAALVDDAQSYVVDAPGSVELVCSAVRALLEGRGSAAEVAVVWSSLARDLAAVEALGDSRDVQAAWAAWHLARAVAALNEGSAPVAAARVRDLAHCVFRVMTWEGESARAAPELGGTHRLSGRSPWEVRNEPLPEVEPERRRLERAVSAQMLARVKECLRP